MIFNVHTKLAVDELAPIIVSLLVNNQNFGSLPVPLEKVFESEEDARQAFTSVIAPLPISQIDAEYTEQLIEAVLSELGSIVEDEDEEDEHEDNGTTTTAVVTPPPSS